MLFLFLTTAPFGPQDDKAYIGFHDSMIFPKAFGIGFALCDILKILLRLAKASHCKIFKKSQRISLNSIQEINKNIERGEVGVRWCWMAALWWTPCGRS